MTPDPAQLEAWLLAQQGWVSAAQVEAQFGIGERHLRAFGETPGLLSNFAVSSKLGYKHTRNATTSEFLAFAHSEIKAAIARFRRIRLQKKIRRNVLEPTHPLTETDSGQAILL